MGWKSRAVVLVGLTLGAMSVSSASFSAGTCRSTCDDHHIDCAKSKSENICLEQWRQCKMTCNGGQKAVSSLAQPIKVTTTTTIAPDPKTGQKVVSTQTKIAKK